MKTVLYLLIILNILAVCLLGFKLHDIKKAIPDDSIIHYTMYIGLNDKDEYKQLIPTQEAKEMIDEVCRKYIEKYTIIDATGAWVDEKDEMTHENTIICYFDGEDEDTIYNIADEIKVLLNQNVILIQTYYTHLDFYKGSK